MDAVIRVIDAIEKAKTGISNLPPEVLAMPGMSSHKVRHFLNNLAAQRYMEVGVWQGSTFVSACYGWQLDEATAIDDFSQFPLAAGNDGSDVQAAFRANVARFLPTQDITLRAKPVFSVPQDTLPANVDVYFYDGGHTDEEQYQAITWAWPLLAQEAIIVVDDANFDGVIPATRRGFAAVGARVLWEWLLPARFNGDQENWWNGLYIAVVRKLPINS